MLYVLHKTCHQPQEHKLQDYNTQLIQNIICVAICYNTIRVLAISDL